MCVPSCVKSHLMNPFFFPLSTMSPLTQKCFKQDTKLVSEDKNNYFYNLMKHQKAK